ncbi:MAG TPA: response regulator, partial [Steroidobacteraceae bacterium]|nr:response regulator [Steroidobacteraceae bacterium]
MKTVLLAYERDQDLNAVESVLQSRGHRVLKARTGVEALDAIRADTPDAVVSDVQLPRLDGFALCRRLREDPSYLHLPFVLHSFRVEGPKYEAFAAEVGAQRFLARGSTLEELVDAIDETPGSGTMRMPALVPELLDRREQDRRRLSDLEKQLRELEATNQQLAASERVARERAERESRARTEFAASESVRVRELQLRIRELESAHKQARAAAESAQKQAQDAAAAASRGAAEESRVELARLATLETRLTELQTARARAQAAAGDAERAFAAQPTPTFLVDLESKLVHAASDSAAALVGLEPAALRSKPFTDVLRGAGFPDDTTRETVIAWRRHDGSEAKIELRRLSTSYAGRACWLVTARDVTDEIALAERERAFAREARALEAAPEACGLVDADGRIQYGNRALLALLATEPRTLTTLTLQSLEDAEAAEATIRTTAVTAQGVQRHETRWRRPDGVTFDVEVSLAAVDGEAEWRVVSARDVSTWRREAERNEHDQQR